MSKLIPGSVQRNSFEGVGRLDAFHVPSALVCLCNSAHTVGASVHVRFTDTSLKYVEPCSAGDAHAIVDPFVEGPLSENDSFWVFIRPSLVSGLTHSFEVDLPLDRFSSDDEYAGLDDEDEFTDEEDEDYGCGWDC